MTVTAVAKDTHRNLMSIISEYPVPASRVWRLWAEPRLLERWWGPPTHPATVTDHDLSPGGLVRYFMTGPDGRRYHGGWRVVAADEPSRLEFEDFFAHDDGTENPDLPRTRTVVTIEVVGNVTRMTIESHYPSPEAMNQALEMGVEQGITQALAQTDSLLADEEG